MKPNRVYESMLSVRVKDWDIRIWRTEQEHLAWNNDELNRRLENLNGEAYHYTPKEIANIIEEFPDIAAYEILDICTRNGYITYPDWK